MLGIANVLVDCKCTRLILRWSAEALSLPMCHRWIQMRDSQPNSLISKSATFSVHRHVPVRVVGRLALQRMCA